MVLKFGVEMIGIRSCEKREHGFVCSGRQHKKDYMLGFTVLFSLIFLYNTVLFCLGFLLALAFTSQRVLKFQIFL